MGQVRRLFRRIALSILWLENMTLVVLLAVMVAVAFVQIIARNLFDAGFPLADPFLRVGVLWLGLLGALVASRTDHHISIDVLTRFMPAAVAPWLNLVTFGFTAAVSGTIAWVSARFVYDEYQMESPLFGVVPAWPFEIIMPIAFGLIALRYLMHAVIDFGTPPADPAGPRPPGQA